MTDLPDPLARSGEAPAHRPIFAVTAALERLLSFAMESPWTLEELGGEVLALAATAAGAQGGALFALERAAATPKLSLIAALDDEQRVAAAAAPEWRRSIALCASGFDERGEPFFDRPLAPGEVLIHTAADIERIPAYAPLREQLRSAGIRALGLVPLHAAGRYVGLMVLRQTGSRNLDHRALRALLPLSAATALAIERDALTRAQGSRTTVQDRSGEESAETAPATASSTARLRMLTQSLHAEILARQRAEALAEAHQRALDRTSALLLDEADRDRFLGHVLRVIVEGLDAIDGSVWILQEDRRSLRRHLEFSGGKILTNSTDAAEVASPGVLQPLTDRFLEIRSQWGQTRWCSVADEKIVPESQRHHLASLGVKQVLTVPLRIGRRILGWISVSLGREVGAETAALTRFAESLAQHATLAIQLERLGRRARRTAMLEERQRIAREMHDTVAQHAANLVVTLRAAARELALENTEQAATDLDQAILLAERALRETREAVHALRPPTLGRSGFLAALKRTLDEGGADAQLGVSLQVDGKLPAFLPEAEVEILRIAQEALTNARRHAQAESFSVAIEGTAERIRIVLQDDGMGFDPRAGGDGVGLAVMRERAARIGAEFFLHTAPDAGTRIVLEMPVAPPAADESRSVT
jgi:signal transduction histidine kinase